MDARDAERELRDLLLCSSHYHCYRQSTTYISPSPAQSSHHHHLLSWWRRGDGQLPGGGGGRGHHPAPRRQGGAALLAHPGLRRDEVPPGPLRRARHPPPQPRRQGPHGGRGRRRRSRRRQDHQGQAPQAQGHAPPRPGLPPHHLARGDEGAQGEEERQDAAVRGHQAAARPAAARRRGRPGRLREGREARQQGPAPEPRRRRRAGAGAGAAGREREGPELAAVAAEHLRGRGGPEQQHHQQHL